VRIRREGSVPRPLGRDAAKANEKPAKAEPRPGEPLLDQDSIERAAPDRLPRGIRDIVSPPRGPARGQPAPGGAPGGGDPTGLPGGIGGLPGGRPGGPGGPPDTGGIVDEATSGPEFPHGHPGPGDGGKPDIGTRAPKFDPAGKIRETPDPGRSGQDSGAYGGVNPMRSGGLGGKCAGGSDRYSGVLGGLKWVKDKLLGNDKSSGLLGKLGKMVRDAVSGEKPAESAGGSGGGTPGDRSGGSGRTEDGAQPRSGRIPAPFEALRAASEQAEAEKTDPGRGGIPVDPVHSAPEREGGVEKGDGTSVAAAASAPGGPGGDLVGPSRVDPDVAEPEIRSQRRDQLIDPPPEDV